MPQTSSEHGRTPSLKKLPVDIQSFELMRGEHYLYVDKTRYMFEMLTRARYYFRSRPRRFGKSLLVSTLKCLFQGKKELFEGLWIAKHGEWDWQPHPVILLDFNGIAGSSPEELEQDISNSLNEIAHMYNVTLKAPSIERQFRE